MSKHKAGSMVIIHGNNGFQEVKVTGSRTVLKSGWKPVRFYWLQVAEDCFAMEIHENYVWESRQAMIEFYINSIANDKKNYQNQIHKAKQLIQFSENYVQGLESVIQSWKQEIPVGKTGWMSYDNQPIHVQVLREKKHGVLEVKRIDITEEFITSVVPHLLFADKQDLVNVELSKLRKLVSDRRNQIQETQDRLIKQDQGL